MVSIIRLREASEFLHSEDMVSIIRLRKASEFLPTKRK